MRSVPNYANYAEGVARGLAYAGVGMLCGGVLVLIADIATRRTLGLSILGTIDLTQLAVMGCVYLAMPLAFLRGAHVSVEFITDALPAPLARACRLSAALLSVLLLAALAWYSLGQARIGLAQGDRSVTLGIPMVLYWAPLLVGLAGSALAAIVVFARELAPKEAG
ncbi:MAG: TRAP transporter small permease [Burkholderiales bacterium]